MKRFGFAIFLFLMTACSKNELPYEVLIQNAQNESIYLELARDESTGNKKVAIIQHGLASNMEHPAVQTAKKAFLDKGYLVITFDSRYSLGKSGRNVADVRLSTFKNDLETVINWIKTQKFYDGSVTLAGHSLGGASILQYAAENPALVRDVIAITPVVSGNRWEKSCMDNMPDFCKDWKKNGIYHYQTAIIPYAVVEESKTYDALKLAENIKAKVLLITTSDDNIIAPRDVKDLYRTLGSNKALSVVSGGGHNFTTERSRTELYDSIIQFIE